MSKSKPLVDQLKPVISETMGPKSAEIFHKFYEFEDDDEVMTGARALLYELIGKKMADQKLKHIGPKHES